MRIVDVLLGRESQPNGRFRDCRLLVAEQVLLPVVAWFGGCLLDVCDKRLAGLQCLLGVDRDRGISGPRNGGGFRHVCEC